MTQSSDNSHAYKRRANRKGRSKKNRDWTQDIAVTHPNAAGIDIGNEEHYVCVPPDRDAEPVRSFRCFTADLHAMAKWLVACKIKTVALQSTGVYWVPVYEVLEQYELEVFVVNARHTKNLPGRKSDVQECRWLMQLHTYGLLRNSFHPEAEIRQMRVYWRQRNTHVQSASTCIQRMQKALTSMNIQLHNVISDLSGLTGMNIVKAILKGERNPNELAKLRDFRVKATEAEVARSLEGNWNDAQLFVLGQELETYEMCQRQIDGCDVEVRKVLREMDSKADPEKPLGPRRGRRSHGHSAPAFDLREDLYRVSGVDLTRIDGIDVVTAQTLISEIGVDMSAWPTEAHFASWLGLCPDNRVSGGKVLQRGTRRVVSRAATSLRMAATSLFRSESYLGAQFRRLRMAKGAPKAITAMAHKLARLVYRLLKYGHEYVDKGTEHYEQKLTEARVRSLKKHAQELGFQVVECATS
jgi:transposase